MSRDITDPSVWYREELQALLAIVKAEIDRRGSSATQSEQAALGGLWGKLTMAVEIAPGMLSS